MIALALVAWAIWHSFQIVEVIYARRILDDGAVYVSKVVCGYGIPIVFARVYDGDVPGEATRADCERAGRTAVAETFGLAVLAGLIVYLGIRYGKEPPRPIDTELKPLPGGNRVVHGRRRRS